MVTFGNGTYSGHDAFGVNWPEVGYFGAHTDKLNTFQLLLVDRSDVGAGDADIYFNYGTINWETGDASGGSGGFGGSCAAAGYSNGTGAAGTNYELPGSHVCGALLDGGPDALVANTNDGVPGQFLFQVRNGTVAPPPSVPEPVTLSLLGSGLIGLAFARKRGR